MRFGKLNLNPALNPAILETATWDPGQAWQTVDAMDLAYWQALQAAAANDAPWPTTAALTPYAPSSAHYQDQRYCLASLADGQQVFLEAGPAARESVLGAPVGVKPLSGGGQLAVYPTDAKVIDRFFRRINPQKGPRALKQTPALGIGTRMTTTVWPGIWRAMATGGFAANAIQNSVRELNALDNLLAAQPAEQNMAFNFGMIETGYTGSTYEGLWVAGVLDALKASGTPHYGADADHLQVKRGAEGLARAKQLVLASRYFSFFTLDVSDVLNYSALTETSAAAAEAYLDQIQGSGQRQAVCAYHQQARRLGGQSYGPDAPMLGRLVGKYWQAMQAVETLCAYISDLKAGAAFDLELSIDEHPPAVATFDCLTSATELAFVTLELQRRGIPVSHVAPNLGVEKGVDYGCPDGLPGLEARTRVLSAVTQELGVMLSIHSGDDLSAATREVIRRATGGRNHFKISPMLQLIFAEVMADQYPAVFRQWWDDALAYAQREAAAGSAFAADCVEQSQPKTGRGPSPHDSVFHHFSFAFVGRRDGEGQFLHRETMYALSPAFYQVYQDRVAEYLARLAHELL